MSTPPTQTADSPSPVVEDSADRPTLVEVDDPDARGGRRRRPTGEEPPLPRHQAWRGIRWALVGIVVALGSLVAFVYLEPTWVLRGDAAVSQWFVGLRTDTSVATARAMDTLTDPWVLRAVRWVTILTLLAFRRVRYLGVFLAALFLVEWATQFMNFAIQRPRPDVEILGNWDGFSHPSRPIASLTVTALGAIRVLVPHGPARRRGITVVGILVAGVGLGRVLLGVDHPSDVLAAVAIAAGATFALTRLLVPHQRHPIVYRRGEHAHVELDEPRCAAITAAIGDQLGLEVTDVELFGAEGSAGSTPMKINTADGDVRFGKLYTRQHQRSDRLYKFARLLLYGRLEGESAFSSVRRLVEYEDHMTRVLRDGGIEVPDTHGIVEITPEREYLIVFDMLPGEDFDPAAEMSDELLDACLDLVRQLWIVGVAHRDIKPGNLLVDGDTPRLIDVAFAQWRPTPWRQAVDLGAMLLMLSLGAGPERVHSRATRIFDQEEIAEALAATDGFAIPSQLRDCLDEDDWQVRDELLELVPERDPIRVHRWDRRRLAALAMTAAAAVLSVLVTIAFFETVDLL